MVRWTKKGVSHMKRVGKKLDTELAAFKKSRGISEAVSTGDPNRGKASRAKPKLPPGQDPYDMYSKGEIKPYGGKLQKRLNQMSPEDRRRYYREVGIRSRAASRAGKTQRLFPISESGFKKGIRVANAVHQKGHFDIAKRDAALTLKALSRVRKTAGMDPRITVPAHKYKPSDAEYAEMQRHAMLARQGKNKKRGINETKAHPVKKKVKKMRKTANRFLKKIGKTLMTPSDAVDVMITGRNF